MIDLMPGLTEARYEHYIKQLLLTEYRKSSSASMLIYRVSANVGNALYSTRNNEALITPGGKTTCMMIYTIRNCVITSDGSTTSSAVPLYSTGPGAESPETYGPK